MHLCNFFFTHLALDCTSLLSYQEKLITWRDSHSNLWLSRLHQIPVHDNVHVNTFANALSETITKSNLRRERFPRKSRREANRFAPASTKTNRPAAGPELPQQDVGRPAANWVHCQKSFWLFFTGKKIMRNQR